MKILTMENLKKYTTIRIGGTAAQLYIPESREELMNLLTDLQGEEIRILSGGSNILMNDERVFPHVIYMEQFDRELRHLGDGRFYCGASVRLQKLIQYTNEYGYGGIEYLMSVPGMIGGAVVMNAGRGRKHNQTISDYIVEVEVWQDGQVRKMSKQECQFSHRNSIFKHQNMVILSVVFQFLPEEKELLVEKRKARIEYSKNLQDNSRYNFGSVFCSCNNIAMRMIKRFQFCKKGEISFSKKTSNWLLNKGNGTFREAMTVMNKAERLNRLLGTKAEKEVIIWE
ncbi:MAG: FAD-binding protein [Lachnospiraceae bacterium]|nr:FAD-binding protein [Lachnospiraceae bacterium]